MYVYLNKILDIPSLENLNNIRSLFSFKSRQKNNNTYWILFLKVQSLKSGDSIKETLIYFSDIH